MSSDLLDRAWQYLSTEVAPVANEMDADETLLGEALRGLASRGFMALRRPAEYGGPELDETSFRMFQEMVARVSGSLAFLQTQHQSAVGMIAKSQNAELKTDWLPKMDSDRLVGIGFSQLRRPGPPMLRASRVDRGYILDGSVPWVTGHGFFDSFLIGAALESGEAVFGIVPFTDTEEGGGTIRFEGPMRLAAMESPRTMVAVLEKWLLSDHLVAFVRPDGWIQSNDMINLSLQAWFALGCARAGLDVATAAGDHKRNQAIKESVARLEAELDRCRQRAMDQTLAEPDRLKARAWAIDLAVRCAHAGVVSTGGSANSTSHNAQRVYREALVYSVSAQTVPIMEATLERIVGRGD